MHQQAPAEEEQMKFFNDDVAPVASDLHDPSTQLIKHKFCVNSFLLITAITMSVIYLISMASSTVESVLLRPEAVITNVTIDAANPSSRASTCIFILSTPGSGSSTMVDLVSQCNKECEISGENWGSLQSLSDFHDKLDRTENQPRHSYHAQVAWKKVFDYNKVQEAERELVYSILNPNDSQCWGFKEIRYGRQKPKRLAKDIEYLSSLCDNPKFILHSREDAMKERESSVIHSKEALIKQSVEQHTCFNSYTQETISKDKNNGEDNLVESIDGCVRTDKSNEKTKAFRFFLEDYLNENEKYQQLWEYLECNEDPPKGGSVSVVTKKKNGDK